MSSKARMACEAHGQRSDEPCLAQRRLSLAELLPRSDATLNDAKIRLEVGLMLHESDWWKTIQKATVSGAAFETQRLEERMRMM